MDKKVLNDLLIKIQNGDEYAFEKLYELANKSVYTFVYSFVKQKETAEDLMQDTFIKIKKYCALYKENTNASAWILQIAKNTSLDYIKKYKRETNFDESEIDVPCETPSLDNNLFLHNIMNKYLSSEERQIILLHDIHGYKNKEIAKFLSLPLGTVLWKYNSAIKKLRKKLKEEKNEKIN